MIQVDHPVIYEEKVKYAFTWVIWLILISTLSTFAITITSLASDGTAWYIIAGIVGGMAALEGLAVLLILNMRLELALTRDGIFYKVGPLPLRIKKISWSEIGEIEFKKHTGLSNGNKVSYSLGKKGWYKKVKVIMNSKTGMLVKTQKGDEYFFSLNDFYEVSRQIKKMGLPLVLKNEHE